MRDLYESLGVSPTASTEEIRAAYITLIRQAHPDVEGGDEEWAKEITAAYNVLSDPAQRARYDDSRSVGCCPICGTDMRTVVDPSAHVLAHLAQRSTDWCELCGRTPTAAFSFRSNAGFILARQVWGFDGRLCASCSKGMYREFQARNISRGPWGFISFFATIYYLIRNAVNFSQANPPPAQPADPIADSALQGRPVFARLGPWITVGLLVLLLGNAFTQATTDAPSSMTDRVSGTSSNLSNSQSGSQTSGNSPARSLDWTPGTCVEFTGDIASLSLCSGRHDGQITDIVSNPARCPSSAGWYVELTPTSFACIRES